MRSSPTLHWALVSLPLLCVLAALWLCFGTEAAVETYFLAHAQSHPTLFNTLKFITDWSNPVFYVGYAIALFLAWRRGNRETLRFILILLCVQAVISAAIVHFIKFTIGRPRPGQGWYFDPMTSRGNYHSLPSGHTTEIMGWTLPLALRRADIWVSLLIGLLIGLVGFSRVYLSWHHPSDVFFGWLLGSFAGFATHVLAGTAYFRNKA
ncbi:phosphatase PAP2 family protein [Pseudodesulfovibrio sp.]|uniref:phosphatase PAP2 family protein n=1 Tax=unclassified Pseudodesulfovibrio TaxID=2661612 RepID=UPI003B00EACD